MASKGNRRSRFARELYDDSPVEHIPTAHETAWRTRVESSGPQRARRAAAADAAARVHGANANGRRPARQAREDERPAPEGGGGAPHGGIRGIPYIPTPRTDDEETARWHQRAVVAFGILMAFFTFVGLLLFARPAVSDFEKRALTEYPAYTLDTFMDGSALTQLALWYSDTYPLREILVRADQGFQGLYGIQPDAQLVGGNVQADELPPADGDTPGAEPSGYDPDAPVEVPDEKAMDEAIQGAITDGVYVKDGAAYNIYYFAQEAVDRYAQALSTCADNLEGQAQVYSILVPNNSGAKLDEETLRELGGTDQRQASGYFFSRYGDKVKGVWIWDALREHRDEYTYFNTDHHWTQLGAYYAYVEFCKAKGIEPADVLAWENRDFGPFLGTYYAELGNDASLAANPDTVQTWTPSSTNDMKVWDENGTQTDAQVITDVTGWAENGLYSAFIEGDQPLERIDNPNLDDGSSCLVVKDSFGCCFVPCLVDSYQTVWVIDFRYSDKSIPQFVREHDVKDVIFVNNISMAGTNPVSQALLSQVQNEPPATSGANAAKDAEEASAEGAEAGDVVDSPDDDSEAKEPEEG